MSALITFPPVDYRRSLIAALEAFASAAKENARLRTEVADRDAMITELQDIINRVVE